MFFWRNNRFKVGLLFAILGFGVFPACQQSQRAPQYTFLFLPRTQQNAFHLSLANGAKSEAGKLGVALRTHASIHEDDYAFQENYLHLAAMQPSVDGVIITPGHSEKLIPTLQRLDSKGIPFIVVDTPLELIRESHFSCYCGFIGTDNKRGGNLAAQYIGETLKEGNILLVRGVSSHRTSQDRETGFLERIKQYPKIKIARIIEGDWDTHKTKAALKGVPKDELPKIHAVFAYNDLMAMGVGEYFTEHHLRPLIVGYDGILEVQSAIIDGHIDATVTQAPETMGRLAVSQLKSCIEQKSFKGKTELTHVTLLKATRTLTAVSSYEKE